MAVLGTTSVLEVVSKGLNRCGVEILGEAVTLHADPKWIDTLIVGDVITLHNPTLRLQEEEMHVYVNESSGGQIFIQAAAHRGKIQTAEVFAGLSGWNRACEVFQEGVAYFVEIHELTARACAKQHKCPMMTPDEFIARALDRQLPEQAVILGDINEAKVWAALCLGNVGNILASPPCQPWCSRGSGSGLRSPDGQLLPTLGRWCGKTRMSTLLVENVAGLVKHPDYAATMQYIESCDMLVRLHGCFQIHKVMPARRTRWLATFVHKRVQLSSERIMMAQSVTYNDRAFAEVAVSPSLSDADVMMKQMSQDERNRLVIPDDALRMLADYALAPEWIQQDAKGKSPQEVLEARVADPTGALGGIMARYGSQHRLPFELLQEKGLLTPLAKDESGIRYFSPWEFISALGYDPNTILAYDLVDAWQMSGNGISVAHGWLQLYKTHMMMDALSPFQPRDPPCTQIRRFQADAIKLSNYELVQEGQFWKLQHVDTEPLFKRAKVEHGISPTLPMIDFDDIHVATREWHVQPEFQWLDDRRMTAVFGKEDGGWMTEG
eukprot:Skav231356  [mRNA]  locus=scaffold1586:206710:208362:- [translate_table: standard]